MTLVTTIIIEALLAWAFLGSLRKSPYTNTNIILAGGLFYGTAQLVLLLCRGALGLESGPWGFLRLVAPILVALCLFVCVSNAALCLKEGGSFHYLLGALMLFGLVVGYLPSTAGRMLGWNGKVCLIFDLWVSYGVSLFAGICIMGWYCAHRKAAYDKDFIIVLGCSISKQGGLRPLLRSRTNRAIRFAWDQERLTGKPARYVPSGGQGSDEVISEGSAMELYIVAHGAEFFEVFPEKESRNTYENFLFSKKIIEEIDKNAKCAFVTNHYHVLRSGMLSRKVGFECEGVGSKTIWYFWPNGFIREIIAIVVMGWKLYGALFGLLTLGAIIYCFTF